MPIKEKAYIYMKTLGKRHNLNGGKELIFVVPKRFNKKELAI